MGLDVLLKHRVVTGATLAIKAGLRDAALPIPEGWAHDAWLALIATAHNGLMAIDEPLIAYRQHADNLVGGRKRAFADEARMALKIDRVNWYKNEIECWRALQNRLVFLSGAVASQQLLAEKIAHLEARAQLPAPRWRRIPGVLQELGSGRYERFSRNWGSVAIDLLVR
jgi:hypothetical protein